MTFSLFKGTFESAACTFEHDGWVTTDLNRGQRLKWCRSGKTAFRWDVIKPALRDGDSSTANPANHTLECPVEVHAPVEKSGMGG